MGSGSSFGGGIEALLGLVGQRIDDGRLDADDPLLLDELGALVAEAHSVAVLGLRSTQRSVTRRRAGPRGERPQAARRRARPAHAGAGARAARPGGRHHRRRRRTVDLRLPRQPVPHHRRRHQRDPAQRHRRAAPRPAPRSGAVRLMAELLPDQLRLMADAFPDEVGFTDVSTGADLTFAAWERRSNQLARWLVGPGRGEGRPGGHPRAPRGGGGVPPHATRPSTRPVRWPCPPAPGSSPASSAYVLGHAGAVVAISGASTTPVLEAARPELPELRAIVTTGPAAGDGVVRMGRRHRSGRRPPSRCPSTATTWPTSCTRRARPAGRRAWWCATATWPWCPTACRAGRDRGGCTPRRCSRSPASPRPTTR